MEERLAQIEEGMKTFSAELQMLAASNPTAVEIVAGLIDKHFMKCGYTAICREIRKYK